MVLEHFTNDLSLISSRHVNTPEQVENNFHPNLKRTRNSFHQISNYFESENETESTQKNQSQMRTLFYNIVLDTQTQHKSESRSQKNTKKNEETSSLSLSVFECSSESNYPIKHINYRKHFNHQSPRITQKTLCECQNQNTPNDKTKIEQFKYALKDRVEILINLLCTPLFESNVSKVNTISNESLLSVYKNVIRLLTQEKTVLKNFMHYKKMRHDLISKKTDKYKNSSKKKHVVDKIQQKQEDTNTFSKNKNKSSCRTNNIQSKQIYFF